MSDQQVANKSNTNNADFDETYKRHSKIVEQAKEDYEQAHRELVNQMKPEHLEPIAKMILELEQSELNGERLIAILKQKTLDFLNQGLHTNWEEWDFPNKLIMLEMMKEKFAAYEGIDWNVHKMKPEELTLPIRMRFKESSVQYLRKQLQLQNRQLEELLEQNRKHRESILEMRKQRAAARDLMEKKIKYFEEIKPKLLEIQQELSEIKIE